MGTSNLESDYMLELIDSQNIRISELENELKKLRDRVKDNLPDERKSLTHKFVVGGGLVGTGYLVLSTYPDTNKLGEIFIKMKNSGYPHCGCKMGGKDYDDRMTDYYAFMHGILNQFAISVSLGLQYGVPIEDYISKFKYCRFPPDGLTRNKEIHSATSVIDYVFRYIEFLMEKEKING